TSPSRSWIPSTRPAETISRPEAGSLISRSAARNASVDDVAISLLHLCWSIEGRHLMCPDQIWRMTSGTPMVRRPSGVPNSRCPGTIMAQARGVTQAAIKGAAHRVVAAKAAAAQGAAGKEAAVKEAAAQVEAV